MQQLQEYLDAALSHAEIRKDPVLIDFLCPVSLPTVLYPPVQQPVKPLESLPSLTNLPEALCTRCFAFLSFRSLLAVSFTCKRLYQVSSADSLWLPLLFHLAQDGVTPKSKFGVPARVTVLRTMRALCRLQCAFQQASPQSPCACCTCGAAKLLGFVVATTPALLVHFATHSEPVLPNSALVRRHSAVASASYCVHFHVAHQILLDPHLLRSNFAVVLTRAADVWKRLEERVAAVRRLCFTLPVFVVDISDGDADPDKPPRSKQQLLEMERSWMVRYLRMSWAAFDAALDGDVIAPIASKLGPAPSSIAIAEDSPTALCIAQQNALVQAARSHFLDQLKKFYVDASVNEFNSNVRKLWTLEEQVVVLQSLLASLATKIDECPLWDKSSLLEIRNAYLEVERYVFIGVYQNIFCVSDEKQQDEVTSAVLAQQRKVVYPETLDILESAENRRAWETAGQALIAINSKCTPYDKMLCIYFCMSALTNLQNSSGGADDLIPHLVYVLLRYNPSHLQSNINFINRFASDNLPVNFSYCLTSFEVAVHFITHSATRSLTASPTLSRRRAASSDPGRITRSGSPTGTNSGNESGSDTGGGTSPAAALAVAAVLNPSGEKLARTLGISYSKLAIREAERAYRATSPPAAECGCAHAPLRSNTPPSAASCALLHRPSLLAAKPRKAAPMPPGCSLPLSARGCGSNADSLPDRSLSPTASSAPVYGSTPNLRLALGFGLPVSSSLSAYAAGVLASVRAPPTVTIGHRRGLLVSSPSPPTPPVSPPLPPPLTPLEALPTATHASAPAPGVECLAAVTVTRLRSLQGAPLPAAPAPTPAPRPRGGAVSGGHQHGVL
eukprot:TRINITY_DN7724_c0_g1_i2.p1 TRINITY_DN7724_c0_g1~~TRINITY_DN7724_c0_g1_i2.p1  ORF type:complete len:984 (+),score=211.22 TRINITY_DN7724_c0_g1_i2:423-2954(+)